MTLVAVFLMLPQLWALLLAHKIAAFAFGWAFFSAVIDGMPAPSPNSSLLYRWLNATLNLFAANLARVIQALCPQLRRILPGSKQ